MCLVSPKILTVKNLRPEDEVFLLYRKQCFHKVKKIVCPSERTLHVLGDGRFENGRRVTTKPFSYWIFGVETAGRLPPFKGETPKRLKKSRFRAGSDYIRHPNRLDTQNDRSDKNQHFLFYICYDGSANAKEA